MTGQPATLRNQKPTMPLGAPVSIIGVIVGRSEFSEGPPSYLVEYESRGKPVRSWFIGEDLVEEGGADE